MEDNRRYFYLAEGECEEKLLQPFRAALKRHKFDLSKLWAQKPPKVFSFVKQDGGKVKSTDE